MAKRYGTLDVSMNLSRSSPTRATRPSIFHSKTIHNYLLRTQKQTNSKNSTIKNEKLRKELKVLNEKLNEKLDKLKLPSVKKKAMSVDLNHSPFIKPKAQVRELQNGYKQIAMYKRQVELLKGKQETIENYQKFRGIQNMVTYLDMEIGKVQEQLKSIKNIKKLQDKGLSEDVDNVEIRQRLQDYEKQIKTYKEKLREIDRKSRKRENEFKKQQAFCVALKQKIRKFKAEEDEIEKPEIQLPKEIEKHEFESVKDELRAVKYQYDNYCKKIEFQRKKLKGIKQHRVLDDEYYRDKQVTWKQLQIQVESYTRLLKDLQIKKYEQTGVKQQDRSKLAKQKAHEKILKLEEIEDDYQPSQNIVDPRQSAHSPSIISKNSTFKQSNNQPHINQLPSAVVKDERNWKGKMKKVSTGFSMPTDENFTESGILLGFNAYLDQNRFIVGLVPIMLVQQTRVEAQVYGDTTSIEKKWQVQSGDHISQINGSFTEQGYLAQIKLKTWRGMQGIFGYPSEDKFHFTVEYGQYFSGVFGGLRQLGQDIRITELGFWILKV